MQFNTLQNYVKRTLKMLFVLSLVASTPSITEASDDEGIKKLQEWLSSIRVTIGITETSEQLTIFKKNLSDLPEEISLLPLKELDLSSNQFKEVPMVIRQLTGLKELALNNNRLSTLPDWLSELTHLEFLAIARNPFEEVPEVIRYLTNLKVLAIDNNQIMALPDWIEELQNLQCIYIDDGLDNMRVLFSLPNLNLLRVGYMPFSGQEAIQEYLGQFLGRNTKNAAQD